MRYPTQAASVRASPSLVCSVSFFFHQFSFDENRRLPLASGCGNRFASHQSSVGFLAIFHCTVLLRGGRAAKSWYTCSRARTKAPKSCKEYTNITDFEITRKHKHESSKACGSGCATVCNEYFIRDSITSCRSPPVPRNLQLHTRTPLHACNRRLNPASLSHYTFAK